MEVGDAVKMTTEFGKYWHGSPRSATGITSVIDIAGLVGLVIEVDGQSVTLLLSNGMTALIHHAHAWLEVLA